MVTGATTAAVTHPWWWWLGLALVVLSRGLAIFDGPWEADEALFSLGVLDFHVPGHRPHPPGFPGFIVLGRLVALVVGDPLLALRLVSALASVAGLVLLDALTCRLVRREVAAATVLAFAFVPGVWAHSARAFTTTPALALLLLGIWLGVRRLEAGAAEPGPWAWAAVGASLCVRPQLLVPVLVIAGVGAVVLVRRRGVEAALRCAAWGVLAAVGVVAVYAVVAVDSGGFAAYAQSLRAHAGRHASALDAGGGGLPIFERLCLVRVMGGPLGFAVLMGLSLVGAVRLFRRSSVLCVGVSGLALAVAASMLWAHHPAFPRYSVLWVATMVPLAAMALDSGAEGRGAETRGVPGAGLGAGLGAALAVAGAVWTWPAIDEMRSRPLPAVAALAEVEAGVGRRAEHRPELVYSPGTGPFARLQRERPRGGALEPGVLGLIPLAAAGSARLALETGVVQGDSRVLGGATVLRRGFEIESRQARLLGQDRYNRASVVFQGVVLGAELFRTERSPSGERFVWLSKDASLWPPTGDGAPRSLVLELSVAPDRAPQRLSAHCDDRALEAWTLEVGPTRLALEIGGCAGPIELSLPDARASGSDPRVRALRLSRAWVEGPGVRVDDGWVSVGDRRGLAVWDAALEGLHGPERFGDRKGRWSSGSAALSFPAEPGRVEVTLARPPFLESRGAFVIETDVDRYEGALSDQPMTISVRTLAPGGRATLRLSGPSFRPAQRRAESSDERSLAAIVYMVARVAGDRG